MTGCGKQFVKPTAPERCPNLPDQPDPSADAWGAWIGRTVDMYDECQAKVDSLHDEPREQGADAHERGQKKAARELAKDLAELQRKLYGTP
jgi:hypothetical protein